jgi:hypothetical protein
MDASHVDQVVELYCRRGCRTVYRVIVALEHGEGLADGPELSEEETRAVLAELKAIMAVYQGAVCST